MRLTTRLVACAGLLLLCACPSLEHVLRSYGYLPVQPPSTLLMPGSIVWVRDSHPLELGLVCTAEQVLGPNANTLISNTKSMSLGDLTSEGISVSGNLLSQAEASARIVGLRSLRMSLSNAQVLEVDDATISARSLSAPTACLAAINGRRRHGDKLTMVTSALRADVNYMAGWDGNQTVSADGRVAALKNVALGLGISTDQVTETSIAAQGLIWGVRDDSYLVSLFAPEAPLPDDDQDRRLLAPDANSSIGTVIGTNRPRW